MYRQKIYPPAPIPINTHSVTLDTDRPPFEIPILPPTAQRGALFDLGANFITIGRQTGDLAAKILGGANPADFPIENHVPERLIVNKLALIGLKNLWRIPDDVLARADTLIDESGSHDKVAAKRAATNPPLAKQCHISLVAYVDAPATEEAQRGVMDGLREASLIEGRDYVIQARSAQGDIATLNGIMDAVTTEGADMVIPLSTPTLHPRCWRPASCAAKALHPFLSSRHHAPGC
jgi:ABC-type uncharacterized transport system substrate-binding protein